MTNAHAQQQLFPKPPPEPSESGVGMRGAIYTKPVVVEFILDLIGYTADRPLAECRILEPSFGRGDFLLPIVRRLLESYRGKNPAKDLGLAIRAIEIHPESVNATTETLSKVIQEFGYSGKVANRLLSDWIILGDFLLVDLEPGFTHVAGNPPYVRQEMVSPRLLSEYRARYRTIFDRADLYVPFFERSLTLLMAKGSLGFICSDRWMKNRYGGPLRAMIAEGYHLACYVDMVDTLAFQTEVAAYPAITIITKEAGSVTRIAHRPELDAASLSKLAASLRGEAKAKASIQASAIVNGSAPWILHEPDHAALIQRLESKFPLLEDVGCKVGIGVATGADKAFIGQYAELDVEADRKLPLITTKDIQTGVVSWQGTGVINPFSEDGSLVSLEDYPRLKRYLTTHKDQIMGRNVAKRNPRGWYRTIDRIWPALVRRPKLLIPDIKGEAHVVFEDGHYYPHHNLYYVLSESWKLRALQAVLRSNVVRAFLELYSVKMRGGYLRYQAQYLRRICLPTWDSISRVTQLELVKAGESGDLEACNKAVYKLYGLTTSDIALLEQRP